MAKPLPDQYVGRFKGLNNVSDPLRLGLSWLTQADNVDVLDSGALQARSGYDRTLAGTYSSAYASRDGKRMYVVDGSILKAMAGEAAAVSLANVTAPTGGKSPMAWAEVNGDVFFTNGADSGIIQPDNTLMAWGWSVPAAPTLTSVPGDLDAGLYQVRCTITLPDGRETGSSESSTIELPAGRAILITDIAQQAGCTTNLYLAPANSKVYGLARSNCPASLLWNQGANALGCELATAFLSPLPEGCDVIAHWRGSIYAARFFPETASTVIYESKPLAFHLFDMAEDFIVVPGRVTLLGEHDDGLVIGTAAEVFAWDGESISRLADYGVAAGQHWSLDDDRTGIFWTDRGFCRALPFANLSERQVSVAAGVRAAGTIVRQDGQRRAVIALQQGGEAFNAFT